MRSCDHSCGARACTKDWSSSAVSAIAQLSEPTTAVYGLPLTELLSSTCMWLAARSVLTPVLHRK